MCHHIDRTLSILIFCVHPLSIVLVLLCVMLVLLSIVLFLLHGVLSLLYVFVYWHFTLSQASLIFVLA